MLFETSLDNTMVSEGESVWTFINNSKATETASLKQLQHFVLSLNARELRHLISVYLRSMIGKHHHQGELTLRGTVDALVKGGDDIITDRGTDASIIGKMQSKYGNKCSKKVLSKMQQNQSANTHILTMNPQVLASSFQYLSFRELCQIQPTCSFFVYLRAQYRGLCHYHVDLDYKYAL